MPRYNEPPTAREMQEMCPEIPEVVTLCGSTRFVDTFNEWRQKLTLEGKIVLSIEIVTTQSRKEDPQHSNPQVKAMLDELHLRKIDLSDWVMVLNVGGYIGESTRKEIDYAERIGVELRYLNDPRPASPDGKTNQAFNSDKVGPCIFDVVCEQEGPICQDETCTDEPPCRLT